MARMLLHSTEVISAELTLDKEPSRSQELESLLLEKICSLLFACFSTLHEFIFCGSQVRSEEVCELKSSSKAMQNLDAVIHQVGSAISKSILSNCNFK